VTRLAAYLAVFVAAATPWLEVLFVVPAGLLAGLGTVPTVVIAAAGNIATLVPVVLLGERLRAWLDRRRERRGRDDRGAGRAARVMERYGLPGLAALGPLVTGAHLAALVATGSGAGPRRTLAWMAAGVAVWSVAAGVLTVLGIDAFGARDVLPDLAGS
jgi:uncharacterized membrane protein